MAGINGTINWQIQPVDFNSSNLAGSFWNFRANHLKSVNDPLRYQVLWTSSVVTEGTEPSAANFSGLPSSTTVGNGDVVNVIFKVETTVGDGYWQDLGSIKKSRDIANRRYNDGSQPLGHRFTIDISQVVSNELSYSLCPINKGTWQSSYYGGMNGGLTMQDNVLGASGGAMGTTVSNYNVSRNGTYRLLKVTVNYEIINGDGQIVSASGGTTSNIITVINSVNQFEKDSLFYNTNYNMGNSSSNKFRFLSRCPNSTDSSPLTYDFEKPIRIDEQAEYLQFYIRQASSNNIDSSSGDTVGAIGLKVETFLADGSAENTFYLRDFEDNLLTELDSSQRTIFKEYQNLMFIQNISPYYINNTAALKAEQNPIDRTSFPYWNTYSGNKITASTSYYRVSMSRFAMYSNYTERRTTRFRYYTIDREDEKNAYEFVRFHWLNSVGGIDSYTAKRDVVEGLTISKDVIERKSGDRTWYQGNQNQGSTIQNSLYHSDTMRGGDIYKGGREVSNVNAERVQSVYTEPLNKSVAKWLEEIMLSPNVWIEMDTEATQVGNVRNPYLRPSDKEYIPVIITNSDVETVNQENGLVSFNIEYTLAHKVITQTN